MFLNSKTFVKNNSTRKLGWILNFTFYYKLFFSRMILLNLWKKKPKSVKRCLDRKYFKMNISNKKTSRRLKLIIWLVNFYNISSHLRYWWIPCQVCNAFIAINRKSLKIRRFAQYFNDSWGWKISLWHAR